MTSTYDLSPAARRRIKTPRHCCYGVTNCPDLPGTAEMGWGASPEPCIFSAETGTAPGILGQIDHLKGNNQL